MSKHSKSKIDPGSLLLIAVLGAAVAAGAFKLIGGKTVNSEEPAAPVIVSQQPKEENKDTQQFTHNYADQIQASHYPIIVQRGQRIKADFFGQTECDQCKGGTFL